MICCTAIVGGVYTSDLVLSGIRYSAIHALEFVKVRMQRAEGSLYTPQDKTRGAAMSVMSQSADIYLEIIRSTGVNCVKYLYSVD